MDLLLQTGPTKFTRKRKVRFLPSWSVLTLPINYFNGDTRCKGSELLVLPFLVEDVGVTTDCDVIVEATDQKPNAKVMQNIEASVRHFTLGFPLERSKHLTN